jgi:CheY-like chemotaxis protein
MRGADRLAPAPEPPGGGAVRVLVVDDDREMREAICGTLVREGFWVASASGGAEALAMASTVKPHLITLDIVMPDVDGWQVLAELKDRPELKDIPVVLVTMLDGRERGFAMGAAGFVQKPVDRESLRKALAPHLPTLARERADILVVEDDPQVRQGLRRVLEAEGLAVRTADDGQEALVALGVRIPGLVVLDLMMPGLDGFQLVAALRDDPEWERVPVIVLTAKDLDPTDLERLKAPQVFRVFRKGASTREELLEAVRELAERWGPGQA